VVLHDVVSISAEIRMRVRFFILGYMAALQLDDIENGSKFVIFSSPFKNRRIKI
jgi:hypothetical protein